MNEPSPGALPGRVTDADKTTERWEELYKQLRQGLLRICYHARNKGVAEDLVQETFLAIGKSLLAGNDIKSPWAYSMTVLRTVTRRHFSHESKYMGATDDDLAMLTSKGQCGAENQKKAALYNRIEEVQRRLSAQDFELFQDMANDIPNPIMAHRLNITEPALRKRVSTARKRARRGAVSKDNAISGPDTSGPEILPTDNPVRNIS